MLEIKRKLKEIVIPVLERHTAFLVDVVLGHDQHARLVRVLVDTDQGISVRECAEIGRDLSRVLDGEGLFQHSYRLEVSSPGIDRPLLHLRQYQKNVGRRFNVKFKKNEERTSLAGKLEAISGNLLTFALEGGGTVSIDFSDIIESKEELPW